MEAITIPHVRIPSINIGGICLPGIGAPGSIGKKGLIWPTGMKEHIKAWYDPKKQGMTNFDVIESYAEDFTASKWVTVQDRAVFTKTASKIHITESMSDGFNTTFIETRQSRYGNEMKINVSGIVAGGVTLKYRYGSYEEVVDITSNGVYTLPAGKAGTNPNGYNGFVMKAKGKCDITITQLPTSILKDFSGNGNHAYLYGGKGKLNSGMGVYQQDYTTYYGDVINSYTGRLTSNNKKNLGIAYNKLTKDIEPYTVKVTGIRKETVRFTYRNEEGIEKDILIKNDGYYTVPKCYKDGTQGSSTTFVLFANYDNDTEVIIEQIPDYPDQLCYDGGMCAVAYEFPILTDYTVMAERTWFENRNVFLAKGNITTEAKYAFIFERFKPDGVMTVQSFGAWNDVVSTTDSCISYLTKNKYNGIDIRSGIGADDDMLSIGGALNKGNIELTSVCCHGAIIVADCSFTEEEINWLKNNLFTIDIPTPAYDFDFSKYKDGSNLGDSITDKYGNVLELHNFAWKGMSGLGGYINFPTTGNPSAASWIYDNQSITFTEIINPIASQVYTWGNNLEEIPSTKVNIIGLNNYKGAFILYRYWNGNALIVREIYNDGEYILEKGESYNNESHLGINWGIAVMNHTGKCNIKVNILPIYPGALVFDGIDDYARLAKMTIKTVVLDFVNLELDKQVYDNRDKPNNHNYFSIYPQADTVAYEARNSNGKTYINGELNTTIKTNDLLGVRCITCASNDLAKETEQYICRDSYLNNYYGKIALYRITGFTEMLTADQVWKWYQKNKAKGGDK